jgi:hypothetical protein
MSKHCKKHHSHFQYIHHNFAKFENFHPRGEVKFITQSRYHLFKTCQKITTFNHVISFCKKKNPQVHLQCVHYIYAKYGDCLQEKLITQGRYPISHEDTRLPA